MAHGQSRGIYRKISVALVSAIGDHAPNDRAILLLDPRLIVLSIRPRASELNAVRRAIVSWLRQEIAMVENTYNATAWRCEQKS